MPQVASMTSTLLFFLIALRPCLADQNPFAPGNGGFDPFYGLPGASNFGAMGAAQARQPESASVATIPEATATGNFAQQDGIYSGAPSGDIEEGTAVAAFGSSPTGYARDTEYICPADNGVTYSTSVEFPTLTYDPLH